MQFLSGKMMMAALGLFGLVAAAPAAAEDVTQIAPISAVSAVSAMTLNNRSIAGERPTVRRRRRIVTFSCHKRETPAVGGRRYTHGSS